MWVSGKYSLSYLCAPLLLYIAYFALWHFATNNDDAEHSFIKKRAAVIVLYLVIIAIYFAVPITFVAIFMVIFSAVTRYFMPFRTALIISPLLALPLFFVYTYYWGQSNVFVTTGLFWSFNLFALVMVNTGIREREARLEAELATRKLEATQFLLNEVVKQDERVRIARNIHDLLGHHLTALTINLQVASRKSEGEVKDSIEQCHQLARLLLSDVREAVSDIRDKSKLNVESSIRSMVDKLPKLSLHLDINKNIQIEDIQIADTIVKAVQETITNTLKHAHGKNISISIAYANEDKNGCKQLQIDISNDGKMPKYLNRGNGLTGIIERLTSLSGSAYFAIENDKFNTQLLIPVTQND
jgi:signal transduction histidine kinase